jgi:hypothetical protein
LCEYEDGMTCPLEAYRGREVLGCEIVASIFFLLGDVTNLFSKRGLME